jgi:hypothetical protein
MNELSAWDSPLVEAFTAQALKLTLSVAGPNRFRKYNALFVENQHNASAAYCRAYATILRLFRISLLDTTAKYATFISIYTALTPNMAIGAARLIVGTGFLISDSA